MKVIGSPGLGGPNSIGFGVNIRGQVSGQADTETTDPNGEDFCGSAALGLTHSGNTCLPFLWQNGTMVALPRLRNGEGTEGSYGVALQINDFGLVAGTAENAEVDSTCPGASVSPQTIEFKPVIWNKPFPWSLVRTQELPTIDGDPDGIAFAINDLGQAVGASGECGPFNAIEQNNLTPLHAVLWRNGNAIDLGSLGGDGLFAGIYATGLNDEGQVVGASDTTDHLRTCVSSGAPFFALPFPIGECGLRKLAGVESSHDGTPVPNWNRRWVRYLSQDICRNGVRCNASRLPITILSKSLCSQ